MNSGDTEEELEKTGTRGEGSTRVLGPGVNSRERRRARSHL